jgi:phage FluMu protein Com
MPIQDIFCKQCHRILMKKPGPKGLCPRCEARAEKTVPTRGARKRRAK